jgi:hypothetical protein
MSCGGKANEMSGPDHFRLYETCFRQCQKITRHYAVLAERKKDRQVYCQDVCYTRLFETGLKSAKSFQPHYGTRVY